MGPDSNDHSSAHPVIGNLLLNPEFVYSFKTFRWLESLISTEMFPSNFYLLVFCPLRLPKTSILFTFFIKSSELSLFLISLGSFAFLER